MNNSFLVQGSGCLAATSVLESHFERNMEMQPAVELIATATNAGAHNDLGSGGAINVVCIHRDFKVDFHAKILQNNTRLFTSGNLLISKGDTVIKKDMSFKFEDNKLEN